MSAPYAAGREPAEMLVLGDSFARGHDDPDPAGGWIGWTRRLADRLEIPRDRVRNLAVKGATCVDTARHQLPEVRDERPRIVAMSCGMNDALNGFDRDETIGALDELFGWAANSGALTLAVALTVPPLVHGPMFSEFRRKRVPPRVAELNEELAKRMCTPSFVRLTWDSVPEIADPDLWSSDELHLNAVGHARVADSFAALIENALERPGPAQK